MTSSDSERQELDRAIDLFGRSTRPGRLLEYLGSKYFSHEEAQLTEFDIAREVFGRSTENFDPAADAVVRIAPVYPVALRNRGVSGQVVLIALIGTNGIPEDVRVSISSGFPELDRSAQECLYKWRYGILQENGAPVPFVTRQTIEFRVNLSPPFTDQP